tara:strand:+ start:6 stop:2513 length:2508 start_codon:yes stop_codon:yes gene_type:complete
MTNSYQGISDGRTNTSRRKTPDYAAGAKRNNPLQQQSLENYFSALNLNADTAVKDAQNNGSNLKQLGELSKTLSDGLVERQKGINENEMLRGINDAYMNGVGSDDAAEAEQTELNNKESETLDRAVMSSVDGFTGERIRKNSTWYEYGLHIGKIQNGGRDYEGYMASAAAAGPININGTLISPDTTDQGQRNAWVAYHRSKFLAQYSQYKPGLLAKHLFPEMQKADARLATRWSTKATSGIKEERKADAEQRMFAAIKTDNAGETFMSILDNKELSRSEMRTFLKEIGESEQYTIPDLDKLGEYKFIHRGTKKLTRIDDPVYGYGRELGVARLALVKKRNAEYNRRQEDKAMFAETFIQDSMKELLNDQDGFTAANVEIFQKELESRGLPRDPRLTRLANAESIDAKRLAQMKDEATRLILGGLMTRDELRERYPYAVYLSLQSLLGSDESKEASELVETLVTGIEDLVEKELKYSTTSGNAYQIGLTVYRLTDEFKTLINQGVPPPEAFERIKENFETLMKEAGVVVGNREKILQKEWLKKFPRQSKEALESIQQRYTNAKQEINNNRSTALDNAGVFYNSEQLKAAVKGIGNKEWRPDPIGRLLAKEYNMTPISVYNNQIKLHNKANPDDQIEEINLPEMEKIVQQLTPEQTKAITKFGASIKGLERSFLNPDQLPVRTNMTTSSEGSALNAFSKQVSSITFDSGQPGIDVFFEDHNFPAVLPGKVKDIGYQVNPNGSGYGHYLIIESIDPSTGAPVDVLYGHLPAKPSQLIGQSINLGEIIGKQGGTGSVQSYDGTIASIDFLAPAAPGSGSMTAYSNYQQLRQTIASQLKG